MASLSREEYLARLLKHSPAEIIPMIAFDLRGPVADITGSTQLLKEENPPLEEKEKKHFINLIESRAETLTNMIFAIADYNRIQRENSQTVDQ